MSSAHRGGHEDSILAKLEREPARRGARGGGLQLAWYGVAATVTLGLIAILAWLAAGAGPAPRADDPRLALAEPEPVPAATVAPAAPIETPAETALIVDSPPEPARPAAPAPSTEPVPPLRMLEPPVAARAAPAPARATPRVSPPAPATRARSQAGRQQRAPKGAAPAPAGDQLDSDVALISAVIYHANGHATGHAAANGAPTAPGCADDACRTRPANQ